MGDKDSILEVAVRGEADPWEIAEPYNRFCDRLQLAMRKHRFVDVIPLHKRRLVWLNPDAIIYVLGRTDEL